PTTGSAAGSSTSTRATTPTSTPSSAGTSPSPRSTTTSPRTRRSTGSRPGTGRRAGTPGSLRAGRVAQRLHGADHPVGRGGDVEAEGAGHPLHRAVLREDLADDAAEPLGPAHLDEPPEQLAAEPLPLHVVADEQGELAVAGAGEADEPADAEERLAPLRVASHGDEGHLAVVVDEAEAGEALVGHAPAQLHQRGVAEVD